MADPQTPSSSPPVPPPTKAAPTEEISLEDLDRLLEEEDPEFTKQLAEVRLIETDTSIEIESSVETEDSPDAPVVAAAVATENLTQWEKLRKQFLDRVKEYKLAVKSRLARMMKDGWTSIRTWPKRSALFIAASAKTGHQKIMVPIKAVKEYSRPQKAALGVSTALVLFCLGLLIANLKGIWLPYLNEPILGSFEEVAEHSFSYDPKNDVELFYSAFPKEAHEYLFDKIKVNLRRTEEHPNPMGAFEIIVSLDSKDTAIEMGSREVEFFDLTQRVLEDEAFESLETEIGKQRFKSRLKREISQKLTQGWVKDISFKTFLLKP